LTPLFRRATHSLEAVGFATAEGLSLIAGGELGHDPAGIDYALMGTI
jgi:hypothetical protein